MKWVDGVPGGDVDCRTRGRRSRDREVLDRAGEDGLDPPHRGFPGVRAHLQGFGGLQMELEG